MASTPTRSSKKKNFIECQRCDCKISPKSVDRHKQLCTAEDPFILDFSSHFLSIPNRIYHSFIYENMLCATIEALPEKSSAKELNGWLGDHAILLHPLTMKALGIPTHWPCVFSLFEGDELKSELGIIWPSDQVAVLSVSGRSNFAKKRGKFISAIVVQAVLQYEKLQALTLELEKSPNVLIGEDKSMIEALKQYLLNSYLDPSETIRFRYFGQTLIFRAISYVSKNEMETCRSATMPSEKASLSDMIGNLSIQESPSGTSTPKGSNSSVHSTPRTPSASAAPEFIRIPITETRRECFKICSDTTITIRQPEKLVAKQKSPITFAKIGGVRKVKSLLESHVFTLCFDESVMVRTMLVCGPTGCGKSMLLSAIQKRQEVNAVLLSRIQLGDQSQLEKALHMATSSAMGEKFVFLIDGLDSIAGSQKESGQLTDSVANISDAVSHFIDDLPSNAQCVASARNPERLDTGLRRRFDMELEVGVPSGLERREILKICLTELKCPTGNLEDLLEVADSAHGFTGSDIVALCKVAWSTCISSSSGSQPGVLTPDKLREAMKTVRASAMREITLEIPKIQWSEVGGQENLKTELKQAVEWPLKFPDKFQRLGIRPPAGILLFGPPGCSKTLIARAVATESGLNFLAVKGPELFSKWVGESEKAVRELFRRARQAAPTIIFFDEIDALSASRGGGGSGVGDRVLTQLLTEMDGLEWRGNVTVIAATNRPDVIDRALLRPGRLDRVIYVPLPDEETREEILKIQLKKIPVGGDLDITNLVRKTAGFSGAEIVALCNEAALSAMRKDIECQVVRKEFFEGSLRKMKPRTDPKLLKVYENFTENSEADMAEGNPDIT